MNAHTRDDTCVASRARQRELCSGRDGYARVCARSRIKRTGSGEEGVQMPRSSRAASSPISRFPCLPRLKIIPTFGDYKNVRPLFRENDSLTDHRRHRTPTRYLFSRLERGLLTGAQTLLGVSPSPSPLPSPPPSELEFRNHSTERMKLQPPISRRGFEIEREKERRTAGGIKEWKKAPSQESGAIL